MHVVTLQSKPLYHSLHKHHKTRCKYNKSKELVTMDMESHQHHPGQQDVDEISAFLR